MTTFADLDSKPSALLVCAADFDFAAGHLTPAGEDQVQCAANTVAGLGKRTLILTSKAENDPTPLAPAVAATAQSLGADLHTRVVETPLLNEVARTPQAITDINVFIAQVLAHDRIDPADEQVVVVTQAPLMQPLKGPKNKVKPGEVIDTSSSNWPKNMFSPIAAAEALSTQARELYPTRIGPDVTIDIRNEGTNLMLNHPASEWHPPLAS